MFATEKETYQRFDALDDSGFRLNVQGVVSFANEENFNDSENTKITYTLSDDRGIPIMIIPSKLNQQIDKYNKANIHVSLGRTMNIIVWNKLFEFEKDNSLFLRNVRVRLFGSMLTHTLDQLSEVAIQKENGTVVYVEYVLYVF